VFSLSLDLLCSRYVCMASRFGVVVVAAPLIIFAPRRLHCWLLL
jgi:hypothetical protein